MSLNYEENDEVEESYQNEDENDWEIEEDRIGGNLKREEETVNFYVILLLY